MFRQLQVTSVFASLVLAATIVLGCAAQAHAQRFIRCSISTGAMAGNSINGLNPGWSVDAMRSVLPETAFVVDVSANWGSQYDRWVGIFGGIRQRLVTRPHANVFAQVLLGQYRTSPAVWAGAIQPGIGVDVPIDTRWSVRARLDERIDRNFGGGLIFGGGVTRFWGRR